ncbi:MAG TPA: metal-dependent hydrolase [Thermoanaerobaculia bacterium]|jgi:inner membrane protein|nr:metal-dependent hydrolase [Thermoanaerobaculia bacterium]
MASLPSHAVAALALGACFYRSEAPKSVWALGAAVAMLPDADVIGFRFGIPYQNVLGHRGITHSLLFALVVAVAGTLAFWRSGAGGISRGALCLYLFLAAASHGLLDAMTNGGLGVAFFAPFDNRRFFFPFRPIQVSPIGLARFFSARAWAVIRSELVWIWVPSVVLITIAWVVRHLRDPTRS